MKQTDPQYKLRLPQDLKDQIEAAAKEAGRSMNAEIVARLEGSFGLQNPAAPWAKEALEQFEKLAAKAGEAAATRVLQAQGFNALQMGTPGIVQTPPPPKAKK
ncbi:Arc family DNA-binding protein [Comamonas thiooxydans]|uniref:Arc family DNA-binding protein n=1 Tax=Comamonas thiooxydans TaxID=363952 RepID=A0AA42Q535_9BURK|nr:Arc family DNA-binding protein [Comamonas thiooxydans]MDH1337415.1 Arc family DNA-binding protein [Comamonas thiooxydans]MDH1743518.1 Arc family DNA-binding protein [Comamonas thiooxydans]MDH1789892.1 Arc family DNA-binding protein [Comamonas thiooxydans]